jgi:hypothetical protein
MCDFRVSFCGRFVPKEIYLKTKKMKYIMHSSGRQETTQTSLWFPDQSLNLKGVTSKMTVEAVTLKHHRAELQLDNQQSATVSKWSVSC